MKVKFLGHAAFLITSDTGVRIITDPYKPGCFDGGIKYDQITEEADIVTISHEHDDHNETKINGDPTFVKSADAKVIKDIKISGVNVYHDTSKGKERGTNIIFNMIIDRMNIVHLGDLGHDLSPEEIKGIGNVDVLFVPVGGYFTIDAKVAESVINVLKPKIVIPMHFKTDKCGFPIAPIDDFVQGKEVEKIDRELEVTKEGLPEKTTVYVLSPAK
ncbi:MAG: MBL fold metallo-hydrolase [Candidatus Stahlbacteria bacterium]|nr:MAG: MBL fold metallo-hydrolase [Candidatus Stahlbacteria bacterium]